MMKLSPVQKLVLDRMEPDKWYNAYDLQCSLATLEALNRKKAINRKSKLGAMAFPRNEIYFLKPSD